MSGGTNLPPLLADGESILVRLRYKAPRPGKPGTTDGDSAGRASPGR